MSTFGYSGKTIRITKAEHEWLIAEVSRASREAGEQFVSVGRPKRGDASSGRLEAKRRDQDGSVVATVRVRREYRDTKYVRSLRTPRALGRGPRNVVIAVR